MIIFNEHTSEKYIFIENHSQILFNINKGTNTVDRILTLQTNFIIVVQNFQEALLAISRIKKTEFWSTCGSPGGKYILLLDKIETDIETSFKSLWNFDIVNVVVIYFDQQESDFKIISSQPFSSHQNFCSKTIASKLETTCKNITASTKLFTRTNLSNCSFKVFPFRTFYKQPFMTNPKTQKNVGVLLEPIRIIGASLRMNITFIEDTFGMEKEIVAGRDFHTFTSYFYDGTFDAQAIDPSRSIANYHYCEHSDVFFFDPYVWVVPKPSKKPNIEVLASVFAVKTWFITFFNVALAACVWYVIFKSSHQGKCSYTNIHCFFDAYKIALNHGINRLPNSKVQTRTFLVIYLFYCELIGWHYISKLSSILLKPNFDRGIENLNDLVDSDLTILILDYARDHLLTRNTTVARRLYDRSRIRAGPIREVQRLRHIAEYGNLSTHILTSYIKTFSNAKDKITTIGSDFLSPLEAAYILKMGHPFREKLNEAIGWYMAAGINDKVLADIKEVEFVQEGLSLVVLTFEHLQGSFIILICGFILSVIVFIGEVLFYLLLKM